MKSTDQQKSAPERERFFIGKIGCPLIDDRRQRSHCPTSPLVHQPARTLELRLSHINGNEATGVGTDFIGLENKIPLVIFSYVE